jgi:hypothetical protein
MSTPTTSRADCFDTCIDKQRRACNLAFQLIKHLSECL